MSYGPYREEDGKASQRRRSHDRYGKGKELDAIDRRERPPAEFRTCWRVPIGRLSFHLTDRYKATGVLLHQIGDWLEDVSCDPVLTLGHGCAHARPEVCGRPKPELEDDNIAGHAPLGHDPRQRLAEDETDEIERLALLDLAADGIEVPRKREAGPRSRLA